ncbi:MAG: exodeoxyribonuclease III [Selenomonadaceae bacterium]|nr:exodeoxyribonuclease III [Selenomonadaceae bacterium]
MKFVSWNVNGLRACLKKDFMGSFKKLDADIFALQEIKMERDQAILELNGYEEYWYSAEKKGYSGTAVFSRLKPINVSYGLGIEKHDHEGRVITLEFDDYYFITVYTPNSRRALERLSYRMEWEDDFKKFLMELDKEKPVIICGDLNVAHEEIDLKNPKTNHKNAGFTDEERNKFTELLNGGFTDTFRYFYPDKTGAYSWWSYLRKARESNTGWRIDYFLASNRFMDKVKDATIENDIFGSDHCPVGLILK